MFDINDWKPIPEKPRPKGKGRNKKNNNWWNNPARKRRK